MSDGTIQPYTSINSVTNNSNSPIVITTSDPHNLCANDQVEITNVEGNTDANGTFIVTVINNRKFSLNGSSGDGDAAKGGFFRRTSAMILESDDAGVAEIRNQITGTTGARVPIVITSNDHGLSTGNHVEISGVLGNTAANGSFFVTTVGPNHFSLNGATGNGRYDGNGAWRAGADTWTPVLADAGFPGVN